MIGVAPRLSLLSRSLVQQPLRTFSSSIAMQEIKTVTVFGAGESFVPGGLARRIWKLGCIEDDADILACAGLMGAGIVQVSRSLVKPARRDRKSVV